ncbi:hypothetical protein BKA67DRAFT_583599 [Truncatella angustata]|uniref:Oxidoreductase-like domain-containing protein n=1 Tax=Truncatella angustata TaxID=152316 RepID=A0A9P8RI28_9PEZI|nr:uncharacterized protein BKA67DRAFT_583599 [Truncatella angustata]KAH6646229.1 hypothetical protein BKA67DRAFT_583599 [Truncatella angustata]
MSLTSREARKHSPTLDRLLKSRLAPIREAALLKAAVGEEKPGKPAAGDCCGSSCNPCVMDLYREELNIWKECVEYRRQVNSPKVAPSDSEPWSTMETCRRKDLQKIPGSYDW